MLVDTLKEKLLDLIDNNEVTFSNEEIRILNNSEFSALRNILLEIFKGLELTILGIRKFSTLLSKLGEQFPETHSNLEQRFVESLPKTNRSVMKDFKIILKEYLLNKGSVSFQSLESKGVQEESILTLWKYLKTLPLDTEISDTIKTQLIKLFQEKGLNLNSSFHIEDLIMPPIEAGSVEITSYLLKAGVAIYCLDNSTCLSVAINNDDYTMTELLLNHGIDSSNLKDENGERPLTLAAEKGNYKIVKLLLDNYADVRTPNDKGETAWDIAFSNDNIEIFKVLLNKSGPNPKNNDGCPYLIAAIMNNKLPFVKLLLDSGANINLEELEGGFTPLMSVLTKADINEEILNLILERKPLFNQKDKLGGYTALMYSVVQDKKEHVQLLINAGASLDEQDQNGKTALHHAVKKGYLEVAKFLIEAGADVNKQDNEGDTPLHHAISESDFECTKFLLESSANVNLANKDGYTPLMIPLFDESPNLEILEQILERQPFLSAQTCEGTSILMFPAITGAIEAVKMLIEAAVPLDLQDGNGRTALHHAIKDGNIKIAKLLIERGADVNKQDKEGYTVLHEAIEQGHLEISKLLVESGSDVNKQNNTGDTPLHLALNAVNVELINLLLESKANVNLANKDGYTPLMIPLFDKTPDLKILERILEKQPFFNPQTHTGTSLLMFPAITGAIEAVKMLIEARVPLDLQDENGMTALHHAIQKGHLEIAKLLIESKADLNKQNKGGYTPILTAVECKHLDIVDLLIEYKADINLKSFSGMELLDFVTVNSSHELFKKAFMVFDTFDTHFKIFSKLYGEKIIGSNAKTSVFGNFVEVIKKAYEGEEIPTDLYEILEVIEKAIKSAEKEEHYEGQEVFQKGFKSHCSYIIEDRTPTKKAGVIIECNRGGGSVYGPGINIFGKSNFTEEQYQDFLNSLKEVKSKTEDEYKQFIRDLNDNWYNLPTHIKEEGQRGGTCSFKSPQSASKVLFGRNKLKGESKLITPGTLEEAIRAKLSLYKEIFTKVKNYYFDEVLKVGLNEQHKYDKENAIKFFTHVALSRLITSKTYLEGNNSDSLLSKKVDYAKESIKALGRLGLSNEKIEHELFEAYRECVIKEPYINTKYKEGVCKFLEKYPKEVVSEFVFSHNKIMEGLDLLGGEMLEPAGLLG